MLEAGGKKTAFAGVLDTPPNSSFEMLHPAQYLKHAVVPSLRLPDVHSLLDAEYEPYDVGVMGELDVEMMAKLFGGVEVAEALSPAWDGGVYYAAQRRSATAAEKRRRVAGRALLLAVEERGGGAGVCAGVRGGAGAEVLGAERAEGR